MKITEEIRAHYAEMGKRGYKGKLKKYGKEYYSRIGKLGALKRWANKKVEK